jgi:hypothetical protein
MSTEQSTKILAELVNNIDRAVEEATKFADEHGLHFSVSLGSASNVDRDIGGEYYGKGRIVDEDERYELADWQGSPNVKFDEDYEDTEAENDWEEKKKLAEGAWSAWASSSEIC